MPDLSELLTQLGIDKPYGNPSRGEAQYNSGWGGFAAGLHDYTAQQNVAARGQVMSTREQLSKMIDSIPDSEQNAPLKLKLKMDIINAGDKHWSDKVLAPHKADSMISEMYKLLQDKLPQQQQQPQMIGADEQGQFSGMNFGVSAPGSLPGGGQGINIPPPVDNTGKFEFTETNKGKWRDVNEVFQDEESGEKYLMQIDANTGRNRRIPLGKAKTVSELNAEKRLQKQAELKKAAVSKGFYDKAVALYGAGPEAFEALTPEVQSMYYGEASKMVLEDAKLKGLNTQSNIRKNDAIATGQAARIPLVKAQTENLQAQPKDPNAITTDEARTNKVLSETIEADIKRLQKIVDAPVGTYDRRSVTEAKTKLPDLIRQRDEIRRRILRPAQRLNNPTTRGGAIPKGSSGPVGNNNDPLGIRNP